MKVIKSGRLRWLGHFSRMKQQSPCKKLTLYKSEGTQNGIQVTSGKVIQTILYADDQVIIAKSENEL
jgi:hypothetical protein